MSEEKVENLEDWQNPDLILQEFSKLVQVCEYADVFSSYTVDKIADDLVTLECDGLYKYLISLENIEDDTRLDHLINESAGDPRVLLVAIASVEQLKKFKANDKHESIQILALPINQLHLDLSLRSMHSLQKLAAIADLEKQKVAEASEEIKYVLSISRELNGQRDIPKLLNLILKKARDVTRADAGSIYTVDLEKKILKFRFTQNDSIQQNLSEFELPINDKSVVGNSVIRAVPINIPDLYLLSDEPSENPFGVKHDRTWDQRIGYESRSMLTIPMFDISHSVIGVIQLINCKIDAQTPLIQDGSFHNQLVREFDAKVIEYAEIVAQQAGIALENANMQDEIEQLFHSFVNASVTAIELRDPTTSGHSHRVAKLTLELAEVINLTASGVYGRLSFDADQMREIEYASLLHDFGKLGVREHVLVKAKKLYPRQYDLVEERFAHIRTSLEMHCLRQINSLLEYPEKFPPGLTIESLIMDRQNKLKELDEYFEFICKANEPTVLEQGGFELLRDIASCNYTNASGVVKPYLQQDELTALSVSRGSLTADEFAEIQSHVSHTYDFLRKIPWGQKLANVPQIAAKHHEKLDGTGYPYGAMTEDIPVQSRMMAIADIFDALTASDRPYKRALPVSKALDILNMEVNGGKVDKDLYDLFIEAKIFNIDI